MSDNFKIIINGAFAGTSSSCSAALHAACDTIARNRPTYGKYAQIVIEQIDSHRVVVRQQY